MGNIFTDILSGGATKNYEYEDARYDYQNMYNNAYVSILAASGNADEAEAARMAAELQSQNDADHDANKKAIGTQVAINSTVNVVASAASLTMTAASIRAMAMTGKATQQLAKEALTTEANSVAKDLAAKGVTKDVANVLGQYLEREGGTEILEALGKKTGKEILEELSEQGFKSTLTKLSAEMGEEALETALQSGIKGVSKDVMEEALKFGARSLTKAEIKTALASIQPGATTSIGSTAYTVKEVALKGGQYTNKVVIDLKGTLANIGSGIADSYAGREGVKGILTGTAQAAGKTVVGGITAAGALSGKLLANGAGVNKYGRLTKIGVLANFTGKALGVGVVAAPAVTAQAVTRSMSEKQAARINDAITVLADGYDYFTNREAYLIDEQKDFYDDFCNRRDKAHAELLEKYADYMDDEGNIADEKIRDEFSEAYAATEEGYAKELEEQQEKWKDFGEYVTTEGISAATAESAGRNDIDLSGAAKVDSQVAKIIASDSFKLSDEDSYARIREINRQLDDGGFMGFIDKIHDTIIHYCPAAAYIEAAAVKLADKGLAAVPIFDYKEKYGHTDLSSLADKIANEADADYELRAERKALENNLDDKAYAGIDDAQAMQAGGAEPAAAY